MNGDLLPIENCIKKEIHFRGETKTDSLEHNNKLVEDYCITFSGDFAKKQQRRMIMSIPNYDSWKLRSREDELLGSPGFEHLCDCEQCGTELYHGAEVVKDEVDDLYFCDEDCFFNHLKDLRMNFVDLDRGDF